MDTVKNKKLILNSIIIGFGTFFTKALSFLLIPFLSRWLLPDEYGVYDLYASYLSLIVPLITLQLEQALYRRIMENKDEYKKYYTICFGFISLILLFICIPSYFILTYGLTINFAIAFIIYVCSFALYNLTEEMVRGCKKLVMYSMANIIVSITTIGLCFLLVGYYKLSINGVMLSFGIGYILGIVLIIIIVKPFSKINLKSDIEIIKKILKDLLLYSLPLLPNSISWWIINVSDRTLINIYHGDYANGIYAIACKIPLLITLFFGIFNLSFQQVAIENNSDANAIEYYGSLFKRLSIFISSAVFLICSFIPIIFNYFVDEAYYDASKYVTILIIGVFFLSLAQFLGNILLARKKNIIIGCSTILAAIINIIGNIVFIPKYELYAAAATTLVAYFLMFIVRVFFVKDILTKRIILLSISMTMLSIGLVLCNEFCNKNKILNYIFPIVYFILFILINIPFLKEIIFIFRRKNENFNS